MMPQQPFGDAGSVLQRDGSLLSNTPINPGFLNGVPPFLQSSLQQLPLPSSPPSLLSTPRAPPPYRAAYIIDRSQNNKEILITPELVQEMIDKWKSKSEQLTKMKEKRAKLAKRRNKENVFFRNYIEITVPKFITSAAKRETNLKMALEEFVERNMMIEKGFEELERQKRDFEATKNRM